MKRQTLRSNCRGQALTELALIAPVIIVLALGMAQFGYLAYVSVTVNTAAREGARVAAQEPDNSGAYQVGNGNPNIGGVTCVFPSANPACRAIADNIGLLSTGSLTATIVPDCPPSTCGLPSPAGPYPPACGPPNTSPSDGYVKVAVSYSTRIFVPVIDSLLGGPTRTMSESLEMRVDPCSMTQGA